jgi:predicted phosphodiesterase
VRGNADRSIGALLDERGQWMAAMHGPDDRAFLASFESRVALEVAGLGTACFVHGSPRSDEECVTERTPPQRIREFMAGIDADVLVTAHVHVSYERVVDGLRLVGPGSVGVPYESGHGARWALLGPDVELRRTAYDVEATAALMRTTEDPSGARIAGLLLEPPARDEVVDDAERRVFAG